MARNAAGNWIPLAPVVGGTVITSTWANNMMSSFGADITESLDRSGRGGMLVPFRIADGTKLEPGYSWTAELSTGFYRDLGGFDMRVTVGGVDQFRWNAHGAQMTFDNGVSWQQILTDGGGAQVPVNIGLADGQTLYWNVDPAGDLSLPDVWTPTSILLMDIPNSRVLMTASSTGRAYVAAASTVAVIERSADVSLSLIGGNINAGTLNFGDTDSETAGQIIYDHHDMEMSFNVEGVSVLTLDNVPSQTVPLGTVDGQTLRWEAGNSAWEASSALVVDDVGNVTVSDSLTCGSFTSTGIDDNATSTTITISDANQVQLGTTTPVSAASLVTAGSISVLEVEASIGFGTANTFIGNNGKTVARYGMTNHTNPWELAISDLQSIVMYTNATPALTINSAGNVGIGTTAPTTRLHVEGSGGLQIMKVVNPNTTSGDSAQLHAISGSVQATLAAYDFGGEVQLGTNSNHPLTVRTNGVERMRIDPAGNALFGTSVKPGQVHGAHFLQIAGPDADSAVGVQSNTNNTSGNRFIACYLGNGIGSGAIETNGANTLGFSTFSDIALKENVVDLPPTLAEVMQLRCVEFDYKDGRGHQLGFIAQEVEQVWPDLVSGEEGTKSVVGLGKMESRLIKAIQELSAKNDALEARLEVLEA